MTLPVWLDVRRLARLFSRDIPQDRLKAADDLLDYAIKRGIVDQYSQAHLARELAPRKMRRALRRVERREAAGHTFPGLTETELSDATQAGRIDPRPRRELPAGPATPDPSPEDSDGAE